MGLPGLSSSEHDDIETQEAPPATDGAFLLSGARLPGPRKETRMQSSNPVVAVVGATGAVGVELMRCLEQRRFPLSQLRLLASARSAGKTPALPRRGRRGRGADARRASPASTSRCSPPAARTSQAVRARSPSPRAPS